MAWTAPATFTADTVLTAADLNTYLRDNQNVLEAAVVTTKSAYPVVDDTNVLVERVPKKSTILTLEQTTSTSFVDLTTLGPQVTVATGSRALVLFGVQCHNSTAGAQCITSVAVGGATVVGASDDRLILNDQSVANKRLQASQVVFWDDLNPGSNVFKMRYRVSAGTGNFSRRRLTVLPY